MKGLLAAGAALGLAIGLAHGDAAVPAAWPQFRGPDSLGVARTARVPERWSTTDNVAWVADVPGRGWSSPVVWGDRVFLTTAISPGAFKEPSTGIYGNDYIAELRQQGLPPEEVSRRVRARDNETPDEVGAEVVWRLLCYDARTGRLQWATDVHRGRPVGGRHRKNTYASETPATDGERVYVYVGNVGLFAYSLDGRRVWQTPLEPRPIYLDFGTASSPIVHAGRVFVLNDNQAESYLAAFDARSGAPVWRTGRDFGRILIRSSFSTPFLWKAPARVEIVTQGPTAVVSYDLDGRELWRLRGVSLVGAPTPVALDGLLVSSSGSPSENIRPLVAIRSGASGDLTTADGAPPSPSIAWRQERGGSYITSPLAFEGRVYVLFDQGFFGATDLASGRVLYKVRIGEGGVAFSASPWIANGRIYCLSEDGDTYVIQPGDEYKLIAVNPLGEMSLATPAIAGDALFVRTATKLYRIGAADAPRGSSPARGDAPSPGGQG
jgi:outer membrane protein assembly factor BamB